MQLSADHVNGVPLFVAQFAHRTGPEYVKKSLVLPNLKAAHDRLVARVVVSTITGVPLAPLRVADPRAAEWPHPTFPTSSPPKGKPNLLDYFRSRVDMSGECWIWAGTMTNGYGQANHPSVRTAMGCKGTSVMAHRLSYAIAHGSVDGEAHLCHTCDNKACVNPDHLFSGTRQENSDDFMQKLMFCNPHYAQHVAYAAESFQKKAPHLSERLVHIAAEIFSPGSKGPSIIYKTSGGNDRRMTIAKSTKAAWDVDYKGTVYQTPHGLVEISRRRTDEERASHLLYTYTGVEWDMVCRTPRAAVRVLEAAERGGADAVQQYLDTIRVAESMSPVLLARAESKRARKAQKRLQAAA